MKHDELRSEVGLIRETMHIACIYGWISEGWDQQRYGCKIDKSPYPDSSDLVADHMEASRIVWAMGKQPKPVNHWLFFAYGDDTDTSFPWRARMVAIPLERIASNYDLGWMAMQDFRKRCIGQPATPSEVLWTCLGVKEKKWESEVKQVYDDCLDQLQTWDRHGVAHVSIAVREIREGRNS